MGHRVTVNLDDCPENKTRRNFTHHFKLVSLVCVLALLNSREEQIALLRGLSDNDCLFACAFFLAALSNSSPTKHARPRRMITHRCSLRTRRTGHPGLTGATLHKWEQKKNKLMFLFFSPPIEVTHHYHCWHTLTLIPGMPGVPSFPSIPGRPWKSRQMSQWTSFGTPCQAPPQLWPEKTKVRSLTFSPFLPTAPCGPWIPRLPCRR